MKMRFVLLCRESNFHDWIQCADLVACEITFSIKTETIDVRAKVLAFRQQLSAPAVLIGVSRVQSHPLSRAILFFEAYRHIGGRFALHEIQNMRGNASHG